MNKKKIKIIITGLCVAFGMSIVPLKMNANTVIPYKDAYGTKCVNIVDLAKSMKAEIKQNGEGLEIFLNGKGLTVYPTHKYVYVNGKLTPLKTEKVKDYESGEEFDFPMGQTPTKDGEGYLIPMSILEEHFGIKGTDKGVEVEEKKPDEGNSNGDQNQGGGSSNNGGDSSSGGSSGGGNSGGGSSSGGSSGGGSSSGGNSGGGSNPTPPSGGGGGGTNPPVDPPKPPTPPPVDPPKPPEPPKPSGLSPSQIESRLPGIGLSYSAEHSGYGINSYVGDNIGVAIEGNVGFDITLFAKNSVNANQTKQILNWALPTAGNEIYNIISSPFSNQTLQRDGKTVRLSSDSSGITISINY